MQDRDPIMVVARELIEVTPENIRLRKALLDPHERKRAEKRKVDVA